MSTRKKHLALSPAAQKAIETARAAVAAAVPEKDVEVRDAQSEGTVWLYVRIKDAYVSADNAFADIRAVTDAISDALPIVGDANYNVYKIGADWLTDANFFGFGLAAL